MVLVEIVQGRINDVMAEVRVEESTTPAKEREAEKGHVHVSPAASADDVDRAVAAGLRLAASLKAKSIAYPPLGVEGGTLAWFTAANALVRSLRTRWPTAPTLERVTIAVPDAALARVYREALAANAVVRRGANDAVLGS